MDGENDALLSAMDSMDQGNENGNNAVDHANKSKSPVVFHSRVLKVGNMLDAHELYDDMEKFCQDEKVRLGVKKLDRTHPIQHILNCTSGRYISPTSMKSFNACPAVYLFSQFLDERKGSAVSIGHTFHKILERWYDTQSRSKDELFAIAKDQIEVDANQQSADDILQYVKNYYESNDYLTGKPMDHTKLKCSNELFFKGEISPLGVSLGVPIYCKMDRMDVRDNGIYVIDYKTGWGDPEPFFLGEHGYLPQMIFYKWAVEEEYGQSINGSYLCLPGAGPEHRYVKMETESLVQQSRVVETSLRYLEYAAQIRESKMFPIKKTRYWNNCPFRYEENPDNTEVYLDVNVKIE
jgi:hypothetical protein